MRNYLVASILLFLLSLSSVVWANNDIEVNYVYLTQEVRHLPLGKFSAEFKIIDATESQNPRIILPFASLEVIFDHHLTDEEIELFEKEFRIFNITDSRNEAHLHEITIDGKNSGMPVSGENASFYWREENAKLYYTPEGLEEGRDFEIILPSGWLLKDSQWQFSTKELTGQLRHYGIIVSDLDDWKKASDEKPLTERMKYIDCIVVDYFNNKGYEDAKIRIRGGSSTQFQKKNYTIKFDKDKMFTGFNDSFGEYQGPRRRIVLTANPTWSSEQPLTFFNNRLAYDLMRDLESRKDIYGVGLAADSYFSLITLNGRFLGIYQFGEHIDVGKGGWSTMKGRQEKLGFDSDGKGLLHKLKRTGDHYPDFGNMFNLIPETEHKYKFDDKGNGVRTQWKGMIPYRYYVQREIGTTFIQPVDIEFKVAADREDGSEMELEPDLSSGESIDYPSFDLEGDGVGLIQRDTTESYIEIDFNDPVKDGKKVKIEFTTLFDIDQFYAAVRNNKEGMFDWMDLDGVLLNIFFVRVAEATDNVGTANNLYFFANHDDLEDYRDVIIPPAKYHAIIWDCNFSFRRAFVRFEELDRFKELLQLPPWMQVAQESDIARQRYIDLFYTETEEGGVLTEQYYMDKLNSYMHEIGNAMQLEEIRWNRRFDPQQIYDYIGQQFSNSEYMRNYLLSLKPDQYLPPSMNNSNHPPVFNSVADKEVKTGEFLRFDVSAVDEDKDELIY
ncbi:MAG: CotH kinase family protein, partial [Candidatus Omnitrophota bacterium]